MSRSDILDRRLMMNRFRKCLRGRRGWVDVKYPKELLPGVPLNKSPCSLSTLTTMVWAVFDGLLEDKSFMKLIENSVDGIVDLVDELGLQRSVYDHDRRELHVECGINLSIHGRPKVWFRVWPAEIKIDDNAPRIRITRLLGNSIGQSPRLQYFSGYEVWGRNLFLVTIPFPEYASDFDGLFASLFSLIKTYGPK